MRYQRLGGEAALDQPRRRRGLHHDARAGPAGQLRPARHQHPDLRRDHIQPLGAVLANHHHRRPAARAGGVPRFQHHLDPRQVRRQRAAVGAAFRGALMPQGRIALLRTGLALCDRGLQILEAEVQLLLRQSFRLPAELQALQLQQQVPQPLVLVS